MKVTLDDLRSMERLHVNAWPAFETARVDGWLWRYSGGGSQRANSVSTLDFSGRDPAVALDKIEALYKAKGVPALVHTFDASAPRNVADLLRARGYGQGETTLTMVKPVEAAGRPSNVEILQAPTAEWREVYLGVITEDRRAVNARILETIPRPCAFFACRAGGHIVSTGLGVADGEFAVVECMTTRREVRRQGAANAVLRGLECWAKDHGVRVLGLQVVVTNSPAVGLYRDLGFSPVATNQFWVRG